MKELKREKVAIIYKPGQEKEMFKVREELCWEISQEKNVRISNQIIAKKPTQKYWIPS